MTVYYKMGFEIKYNVLQYNTYILFINRIIVLLNIGLMLISVYHFVFNKLLALFETIMSSYLLIPNKF